MIAGTPRRFFIFASMLTLGFIRAMPVRADESMVDNPRYTAWASFKPGSSSTINTEMAAGSTPVHIEITSTLKSVTADKVEVERVSKVSFMGHETSRPATTESYPAKVAKEPIKVTGEKDVEAMGKSFKCKVYEYSGTSAAAMAPSPRAGAAPAAAQGKATIYVSKDVPGGVVKMEFSGANGQVMNSTLTAMVAK